MLADKFPTLKGGTSAHDNLSIELVVMLHPSVVHQKDSVFAGHVFGDLIPSLSPVHCLLYSLHSDPLGLAKVIGRGFDRDFEPLRFRSTCPFGSCSLV